MTSQKEGAHAFMATSNDSLNVNGNGSSFPTSSSPNSNPRHINRNRFPNESAVLSPPSHYAASDGQISPMDTSTLPSRQHVSSASQLPPPEITPPSDQDFWQNQYRQVLEIHEKERKLWSEEKQFLERQVSWLREELNKKRSDSGTSFHRAAKENDKVFADADVIRQSQEKLRQFSNVSPMQDPPSAAGVSVSKAVQEASSSDDYNGRRHSSSSSTLPPTSATGNRLSSITEDEAAAPELPRRVSISEIETTITGTPPMQTSIEEDPISPPTTTQILTPPMAKMHAGRTPPIPRSYSDTASHEQQSLSTFSIAARSHYDPDDDPELDSPKMLPSAPRDGQNTELTDLNKRLQSIASDPENNLPEAVRSATPSAPEPSNGVENGNDAGGIKLKTKRSLNFGAPLGDLRANRPSE